MMMNKVRARAATGRRRFGGSPFHVPSIESLEGRLLPAGTPFLGKPVILPATIQAEDFDRDAAGVAYYDVTRANQGGSYRSTRVDIEPANDVGGGYNVGWIRAGEWLNYAISVPAAGSYLLEARVQPENGGKFHFEFDGVNKTGPMSSIAGDGRSWITLKTTVQLAAGVQTMRAAFDVNASQGFIDNLNWVRLTPVATPPATPMGLSAAATAATSVSLTWSDNASNESGYTVERKLGAAESYATLATVGANTTRYTDVTAAAGTQYVYRVKATGPAGDSPYSNESTASTPTVLTASAGGPYTGTAGEPVNMQAAASGGSGPLTYAWDLDSDGIFETPRQVVSPTYTTPGDITVKLQVTDVLGQLAIATATVSMALSQPANALPTATLVSPSRSGNVAAPGYFAVRADAADSDGAISKVEFYQGAILLGVVTAAPYSISWTDVSPGTYTLTAKSFDDRGASATSNPLTITVVSPTAGTTYVVDPSGSDGNPGTASAPLKSINRAAQLAMPGDTVLIKPGTYRESVILYRSGTADRPITFRAETPGTVVIDGADPLTGWTRNAANPSIYSVPWSYDFLNGTSRTQGEGAPTAPASVPYAEQVIVNDTPMTQVLSFAELKAGTFYVDWNADRMYVWLSGGADPATAQVLASTRQRLFATASPTTGQNMVVKGITFRHAANFAQRGAVETGHGWRLEDCIVEWTNGTGVEVFGDDVVLLRVVARDNGQSGISGARGANDLIKDSASARNNYKGYSVGWEAGGGKFALTNGMYVVNYTSYENIGPGIWFDISNRNFAVANSTFYANRNQDEGWEGVGLMTEINQGPGRFENNLAYDNQYAGIFVAESRRISILGNTLINNKLELRNIPDREYAIYDIAIIHNKFKNSPVSVTTLAGNWTTSSGTDLKLVIDFNTYDNPNNTALFLWGDTPEYKDTLEKVRRVLGFEKNGTMGTIAR